MLDGTCRQIANNRSIVLNPESIDFSIEPLSQHHDRAIMDRDRQKIIGYYTLSMSGIDLDRLPEQIAKKLPKYPVVGVTLIGRLAVSIDYKGFGWGKLLIMDALHRSLMASKTTTSFAVVVDAIDDEAVRFYQRFDFQSFPDSSAKLFRTMANIDRTFS
jgi:predicted GNAT family N-acyltransferase